MHGLDLELGCQYLGLGLDRELYDLRTRNETILDVNDPVLDSVSNLHDLRTQSETISRPVNVAYIMKVEYFYEFAICNLAMFS